MKDAFGLCLVARSMPYLRSTHRLQGLLHNMCISIRIREIANTDANTKLPIRILAVLALVLVTR